MIAVLRQFGKIPHWNDKFIEPWDMHSGRLETILECVDQSQMMDDIYFLNFTLLNFCRWLKNHIFFVDIRKSLVDHGLVSFFLIVLRGNDLWTRLERMFTHVNIEWPPRFHDLTPLKQNSKFFNCTFLVKHWLKISVFYKYSKHTLYHIWFNTQGESKCFDM